MSFLRRLGLFVVLYACSACSPEAAKAPAPEPISVLAERFVADLGERSGQRLTTWFRDGHVLTLTRRCPDCPTSRRLRVVELSRAEHIASFGDTITASARAAEDGSVANLRVGQLQCEGSCCEWSIGLLDHGAVHLERACFERDAEGTFVREMTLIDA